MSAANGNRSPVPSIAMDSASLRNPSCSPKHENRDLPSLSNDTKFDKKSEDNGGWNVYYDKDQHRFFYADGGSKVVTWTRPPDFDKNLERKTYILYKLSQELASNETASHEVASVIIRHLTHFVPSDYMYSYFNIPVDEIETLVYDRCAFIFRGLLDEKMAEPDDVKRLKVNSSFEAASKLLQTDKRFGLVRPSERKAIFQNWKATSAERETAIRRAYFEHNLAAFAEALQKQKLFRLDLPYQKAQHYFSTESFWKLFNEQERRKAYELCKKKITDDKRKLEEETRRNNMEALGTILVAMPEINHSTTWATTQRLLLENEAFNGNKDLLKMDKNDALDVFSNYKKSLQNEYRQTIANDEIQQFRRDRKIRDNFHALLLELRDKGMLKLNTKWKEFLPLINGEQRYLDMCTQPGSTALDYFKFLMEDWKEEFTRNLKDVTTIFETAGFQFGLTTTFESLVQLIKNHDEDERVKSHNYQYIYEHFMKESVEKESHEEKLKEFFSKELANLEGKVAMKDVSAVKKALGSFITKKEVEKVMLEVYDGYMQSRNDMDKPDTRYSPRPDSPMSRSTKQAAPELKTMNADLFTLTYGALVVDLLRDLESEEEVNAQLEKMGHNIGMRIADDLLSKNPNIGVTAHISQSNLPGNEFSLILDSNPLVEFVEIPAKYSKLRYSQIICGAINGALEAMHLKVNTVLISDVPEPTEIRVKLVKILHEYIPSGDDD